MGIETLCIGEYPVEIARGLIIHAGHLWLESMIPWQRDDSGGIQVSGR